MISPAIKVATARIAGILISFVIGFNSYAQQKFPHEVEKVLVRAGNNRKELESAIRYFQRRGDSLKLRAVYFLIRNMDLHSSVSYYWADNSGKRVYYNEFDYPDYKQALKAFDSLKSGIKGLHPVPYEYRDIDSMKAGLLIENVELAFETWRVSPGNSLSFDDFCEYVLPYRVSSEPLQNWRRLYSTRFYFLKDGNPQVNVKQSVQSFITDNRKWFVNTYGIEQRKEPLPRLGALQLISRAKGPCEDIADLSVFALRSQGIACANDEVPCWATSSGKHFLNAAFTKQQPSLIFDASSAPEMAFNKLVREPAKVIRTTYSRRPNTLAAFESIANIPAGFMQKENYIDVTAEYWSTKNVDCRLFDRPSHPQIAYACVMNFGKWVPAWWGKVNVSKVTFDNMCEGAVYLPMYFSKGKMIPAGYPVAIARNNQMTLQPDIQHTRSITLLQQEQYLAFRPGKKYQLFYWDNEWKPIGEKTATPETQSLVFDNVPRKALLLLRPEYSKNKERPFVITDEGERLWW